MSLLVENDEVLAFLNVASPTDAQSAQLDLIIKGASAAVEKFCGRTFVSTSHTEYCDGNGRDILALRQYPIISVASVMYSDDASSITQPIAVSDYWIMNEEGWLRMRPSAAYTTTWIKGIRNYAVVYRAGYAVIPDDLKLACLTWIAILWQRSEFKLHAIASRSFGEENVSYRFDKIPQEVEAMLEKYVRRPYA